MSQRNFRVMAAAVPLCWLLVAIPFAQGQQRDPSREGTLIHRPSDEALRKLTVEDAKQVVLQQIRDGEGYVTFGSILRGEWSDVNSISFEEDALIVTRRKGDNIRIPFEELKPLDVRDAPGLPVSVMIAGDRAFMDSRTRARTHAIRIADALHVLRNAYDLRAAGKARKEDETFNEMIVQYRGRPTPAFPEEARRSRVQAEFAVEQKRFDDAARLYREALRVAPWWPEGYYNRSLVLAELRRYAEAIAEMKRFLALEPEHPRSRAAQDQIYKWESVAPR